MTDTQIKSEIHPDEIQPSKAELFRALDEFAKALCGFVVEDGLKRIKNADCDFKGEEQP